MRERESGILETEQTRDLQILRSVVRYGENISVTQNIFLNSIPDVAIDHVRMEDIKTVGAC